MADFPEKRVAVILPPREGFGPQSAGAVALLQARLAKPDAAHASGFAVTIVGAPQKGEIFPLPFLPADESWSLWGSDARYAAAVTRVLRRLKPDLIEVHNRPDLARRLAASFAPRRIALFLHNDPRSMRGAKHAAARAALSRKLGAVVCVSRFLADAWMEGIAIKTVLAPRVLPNSLDLSALPSPLPPAERDKVIVFAGRVVADKGADSFVRACAQALPQLPGWQAIMIGADRFRADSPETPFTERLRPEAEAAGIALLGYRDHATVMAALSRAAIAVLPSRWPEPFGLAALEALANGAALLASHRGGLAELAAGASVAIDPDDVSGVAAALVSVARDPERRAALSQAGLDRALRYDLPEARRRLDALRMELLTS
ncbi:glycosyltransferase family 4 protein [Acidisoma cellulosilytica]|uniref:Glycosyltransferase family 4 protein n=1 Tax=Acidisoma cellulosilyticum TaxID=2802395 RepID=A0A963Z1D8_9PROT|nr:glycosyltransferase family 4 protein [Acidisoma cellulosilyticum]MCB8880924.1 glycosyltransferase family 4 protein [Acidisoma cellulosilyticum]